ncbi:MAG TPA: response regulator [Coleofasciculaceae cyanobacterium]
MKILCVEDDEGLAKLLQRSLSKQHYQVELATDGQTAWDLAETEVYDLILLDWMLPGLTGIEFCQRLRTEKHATLSPNRETPILLMTGLDAVTHKVMGLDAGADDYVVKPFDLDELLARIRALLRRNRGARSPLLQWGDLCLNPNSCEVTYQGQPILLAAKEYELLELFLRHPDQIFSLERLLIALWAVEDMPSEGAVRAHVKGLRQKLKQSRAEDPIETIYKLGYRLKSSREPEKTREKKGAKKNRAIASVPPELWEAWQECRQSYHDRLLIIQQAATALQNGILTAEQRHEAEREAHTLIGSLGTFGLDKASRTSRQIQKILKQPEPLSRSDIDNLIQRITALHLLLENSKLGILEEEKTVSIPALATPTASLLIVENDFSAAQLLAKEALSWGVQAEIAADFKTAQRSLDNSAIHVVLLNLNGLGAASGLEFLATTRRQYPDIPVVTLAAEDSFEQRVAAARLGSCCFLHKPIAPAEVLAAVNQVLQQTAVSVVRLLIVDDDLASLHRLSRLLQPCGYQITQLSEPDQFWQTLEQTVPDLLILGMELSEPTAPQPTTDPAAPLPLSSIELCQVIRSDLRWNRLPVLFLSAHLDAETVQRSFVAGADDVLSKPVVAQELLTRVQTRLEQRKLWETNDLDALTGLSLRRKAHRDLTLLLRLAQRQKRPFGLALLDLDHFQQINEQYGYEFGDQGLSYLGKLLRQLCRQEDVLGRWGGEEFIVGLYGITKQDGIQRLEEVLRQFSQHEFLARDGTLFHMTFSAGIAQLPDDGADLQTLYHYADQALDRAKSTGRNRVAARES